MESPVKFIPTVACAAALLLAASASTLAHEGRGRFAKLVGPDGSEARGVVVLTDTRFIVHVEGLPVGDYNVLLDDGTGTKTSIGTLTVAADDEDDDDGDEGKGGSADDGDDDDEGEDGDHDELETSGSLKLAAPDLPFGAASPADLGGRAICLTDAAGNVVLSGTTPEAIVDEPDHRSGRCELTRPDPAVDEDAEGAIKVESGDGRIVIKVHLDNLDAGKVYDVILTNPADGASESLGMVTINDGGEGHLKVDSEKGDAIPFGAGSLEALVGFGVSVNDPAGATVLKGEVCAAAVHDDDEDDDDDHDGDGDDDDHEHEDECEADLSRPDPAVDEDAKGEVESSTRELDVEVEHLAAGATYDVVLTNPADSSTQTIGQITTDDEGEGELEVEAAEGATLAFGGFGVAVVDASGATVLVGTVPAGECRDDDDEHEEGDDHDDDEHEGPGGGGGAIAPAQDEPLFLMSMPFDEAFLRGDTNRDGSVDISDAVAALLYLFAGGERPYCLDAVDANDDGVLDITDPISVLSYLFIGAKDPPSPGILVPGSDPTADSLYCEEPGASLAP